MVWLFMCGYIDLWINWQNFAPNVVGIIVYVWSSLVIIWGGLAGMPNCNLMGNIWHLA